MMIHQQLLPQKPLLHIKNTSKFLLGGSAAHSKIFLRAKKVRQKIFSSAACLLFYFVPCDDLPVAFVAAGFDLTGGADSAEQKIFRKRESPKILRYRVISKDRQDIFPVQSYRSVP